MKRWKRFLCVALGFALIFGMALRYPDTAFASELTNDSIKQKEAEISKAKEEKRLCRAG